MEYVFVGLGGVLGALSRYGLSRWVGQRWRGAFPLATFIINITGSFVLGLLYVVFFRAGAGYASLKYLTTTGFLGAYTTYSTFSYEIVNLVQDGENLTAAAYFAASVAVGLLAAWAGILAAQMM